MHPYQPITKTLKLSLSIKHVLQIWITGTLLAIASVATVYYYETKQMQDELERRVEIKRNALDQTLESTRHLMLLTGAFLQNSNHPSQQQFEQFLSDQTDSHTGVRSIVWAPLTPLSEIPQLEQDAKQDGFWGYRVEPKVEQQVYTPPFLDHATLPVFYVSSTFEASDELGLRLENLPENIHAIPSLL